MKRFTASILVLLGAASFGVLSTMIKLSYHDGFTTAEVTGSQVLFGSLGLWFMSIPALSQLRMLSARTLLKLMLCGTFAGLTGVFYYLSLQTVSASLAVILLFQFVWMGMLVDWFDRRHLPDRYQRAALVLVLIGTVLAAGYQTLMVAHADALGIALGLLAAVSYTGNIYVSARVAVEVPPLLRSALFMTGAAITTLLIFPPQFLLNGSLSQGLWLWSILLAVFGVIIPPYLFARGMPRVGAGMATILGSIELPVVIVLAALVLREPVDMIQWAGVLLILLGIVVSEQKTLARKRLKKQV